MQHSFGSGTAYGIVGANSVPRKFGALQDISLDISFSLKELYGQNQFAIAIGRGQGKVAGKAKIAVLNGGMINDIFFSQSNATGQTLVALAEAASIPAVSTYTVTVSQSATFKDDLGVIYAATGIAFLRVATSPTVGQYSVAAGIYTFAAADEGVAVAIDYSYTAAAAGNTTTIINTYTGTTPQFIAVLQTRFNGKQAVLRLNACASSKLSIATKADDFTIPEFDFSAFVDVTGTLGTLSLAE